VLSHIYLNAFIGSCHKSKFIIASLLFQADNNFEFCISNNTFLLSSCLNLSDAFNVNHSIRDHNAVDVSLLHIQLAVDNLCNAFLVNNVSSNIELNCFNSDSENIHFNNLLVCCLAI
jgi:hypothetical protein